MTDEEDGLSLRVGALLDAARALGEAPAAALAPLSPRVPPETQSCPALAGATLSPAFVPLPGEGTPDMCHVGGVAGPDSGQPLVASAAGASGGCTGGDGGADWMGSEAWEDPSPHPCSPAPLSATGSPGAATQFQPCCADSRRAAAPQPPLPAEEEAPLPAPPPAIMGVPMQRLVGSLRPKSPPLPSSPPTDAGSPPARIGGGQEPRPPSLLAMPPANSGAPMQRAVGSVRPRPPLLAASPPPASAPASMGAPVERALDSVRPPSAAPGARVGISRRSLSPREGSPVSPALSDSGLSVDDDSCPSMDLDEAGDGANSGVRPSGAAVSAPLPLQPLPLLFSSSSGLPGRSRGARAAFAAGGPHVGTWFAAELGVRHSSGGPSAQPPPSPLPPLPSPAGLPGESRGSGAAYAPGGLSNRWSSMREPRGGTSLATDCGVRHPSEGARAPLPAPSPLPPLPTPLPPLPSPAGLPDESHGGAAFAAGGPASRPYFMKNPCDDGWSKAAMLAPLPRPQPTQACQASTWPADWAPPGPGTRGHAAEVTLLPLAAGLQDILAQVRADEHARAAQARSLPAWEGARPSPARQSTRASLAWEGTRASLAWGCFKAAPAWDGSGGEGDRWAAQASPAPSPGLRADSCATGVDCLQRGLAGEPYPTQTLSAGAQVPCPQGGQSPSVGAFAVPLSAWGAACDRSTGMSHNAHVTAPAWQPPASNAAGGAPKWAGQSRVRQDFVPSGPFQLASEAAAAWQRPASVSTPAPSWVGQPGRGSVPSDSSQHAGGAALTWQPPMSGTAPAPSWAGQPGLGYALPGSSQYDGMAACAQQPPTSGAAPSAWAGQPGQGYVFCPHPNPHPQINEWAVQPTLRPGASQWPGGGSHDSMPAPHGHAPYDMSQAA